MPAPAFLLSLVIFFPLLVAGMVLALPKEEKGQLRTLTLAGMVVSLAQVVWVVAGFDPKAPAEYQFEHRVSWLPDLGISYHVGVDGLSVALLLLTAVLGPLAVLSAWRAVGERVKALHVALLVLQSASYGAYSALDTVLFFGFFELVLLPMAFLIGLWGAEDRQRAAMKYLLMMSVGSVLLLVGFIAVSVVASPAGERTFDAPVLATALREASRELSIVLKHGVITDGRGLSPLAFSLYRVGPVLFFLFAAGFAVKVPLFPLHTWVPDAQAQAPALASMLLAGKLGVYGFWRFAIPFFPVAARNAQTVVAGLAVAGLVYASVAALAQRDLKRLLGYTTVAHLSVAVLGVFAFTAEGASGSAYQLVSHGLTAGALFLLVGYVAERRQSRLLSDYGGLGKVMPVFSAAFMVAALSSIALPGTSGFVGEFLVLMGSFKSKLPLAFGALAATSMVLGAAAMLWLVQKVFFGPVTHAENLSLRDLDGRERLVALPLVVALVVLGLRPQPLLEVINSASDRAVARLRYALAEDVVDDATLMADGPAAPGHDPVAVRAAPEAR